MRIAMVGTGYVGLVSGACFSEFGTEVTCVDLDAAKIERLSQGQIPIYEPGLEALVTKNVAAGRLTFTTDLRDAVAGADAVFVAVGTPTNPDGRGADLTMLFSAARDIAEAMVDYTVLVTKSTVPVGTGREVARVVAEANPKAKFDVVSNPEFLREGAAIEDFMRPNRVVIGTESAAAREMMRLLYRPLYLIETPIVFTDLETAELIKYASNAFLATKITFINEMADLCEAVGADVHDVARGMGLDGRIGRKFLHPGPGYGGSCFPKDTEALSTSAKLAGCDLNIVDAVIDYNRSRKAGLAERVARHCDGELEGKRIAILGLSFKPNTDDMRESPAIPLIEGLIEKGALPIAYDPAAMEQAKALMPDLSCGASAQEILEGADALVVVTEWNEFRALDPRMVARLMAGKKVVDLRNIFDPQALADSGLDCLAIGRPGRQGGSVNG